MINQNKTGLRIFDQFQLDRTLPKYQKNDEQAQNEREGVNVNWGGSLPTSSFSMATNGSPADYSLKKEKWYREWFPKLFPPKPVVVVKNPDPEPTITVAEFFQHIKVSLKDAEQVDYDRRNTEYLTVITQAEAMGQIALVEKLKAQLSLIKMESLLYAKGNMTTITEAQIVSFVKESEKGLRLDWIKNFTRILPSAVADLKLQTDALEVFDNYVILHYDPQAKSYAQTEEELKVEQEKKKDPILFGVIQGSRKLYYVADWQDEFCTLSLEDFIAKFGVTAISANNLSVNSFIK